MRLYIMIVYILLLVLLFVLLLYQWKYGGGKFLKKNIFMFLKKVSSFHQGIKNAPKYINTVKTILQHCNIL